MSPKKTILVIVGAIFAVLLVRFAGFVYIVSRPPTNREISGPITLAPEWTEIVLNPPLKREDKSCDFVVHLAEPVSPDYESKGVRLADGSIVIPEAQLVDSDGSIHSLVSTSVGKESITLGLAGLRKGDEYRIVRMRSYKNLRCSMVTWHCRNLK